MVRRSGRSTKRLSILVLIIAIGICLAAIYVKGYYQARKDDLFVGSIETFVPYGGTPSGKYEIKPIGYLSLGIYPDPNWSDAQYGQAFLVLREDQARSRELWPYYRWLARIEEMFR
jgi:hypothetical protein